MSRKNILIIGGSSGIGAEIVRQLNQEVQLFLGSRATGGNSNKASIISFKFDVTEENVLPDRLPEMLDGSGILSGDNPPAPLCATQR